MGTESPVAVLYDMAGNEMPVQNGVAIPASTPMLLVGGSDGTNSRYITLDTSGRQVIVGIGTAGTPVGGVLSIQGVASGTAVPISGSVTISGTVGVTQSTSPWVVSASGNFNNASVSATGSAIPNSATYIGADVVSSPPSLAAGNLAGLTVTTAGRLITDGSQVTQPVSGTVTANAGTGNFSVVQATAANLNATVTASGNFNNASVSATAAAPPASATYIGGSVTTSSPTYTTGQMDPLSLTTAGALRVDGSAVTQPISGTVTANAGTGTFTVAGTVTSNQGTSPWVTNITQFGGSNIVTGTGVSGTGIPRVTVSNDSNILATQSGSWTVTATQATAANLRAQTASEFTTAATTGTIATLIGGAVTTGSPTYTTGQMDPLSLTTAGALRIDGSAVTQPVSGTVTANQGTPNTTANSWPITITDGTHGPAAVKAASTAAVAADLSLVVGLSPNSPLPTGTNNIGSVNNVQTAESTAAWTSATTNNTALALTVTGYGSVTVTLNQGTTITGGAVTFEGSDTVAGTNWYPISMVSTAGATVPVSTYTLTASTNVAFQTNVAGFIQFRVRLSPAITGTGTVNIGIVANASATEWQQATFITDGSHGPVAVKPASTAPVVTDAALVVVLSPNQPAIPVTTSANNSTPGNSSGYTTQTTVSNVAQQATTYTEQSANFTGSVKSSSANDASAGTGARTITIYYVDATGATAGNEVATLNGTTAVNLVTTTKCFIEKIVVTTVGSGGVNAGIISLFTGAAGAGTTVATIAVGDNQTYLGHHYVVTGKTCNITGITGINNSTSQNTVFTLQAITLPVANEPSVQVSDWVSGSQNQQIVRLYDQLIKVPGPARIQLFGANGGTPSIKSQGSFDYYDQ